VKPLPTNHSAQAYFWKGLLTPENDHQGNSAQERKSGLQNSARNFTFQIRSKQWEGEETDALAGLMMSTLRVRYIAESRNISDFDIFYFRKKHLYDFFIHNIQYAVYSNQATERPISRSNNRNTPKLGT
jgi:hypothetical protein